MNLILEILKAPNVDLFQKSISFDKRGGKIGRSKSAKWTLNDPTKHISNYHAEITYNDGHYYISDISTNGMHFENPHKNLAKGLPARLTQKSVFVIGEYTIGVKTIEEDFSSQKPFQIQDESNSLTIADDFFVGNESKDAFGVIDSSSPEDKDIVSLLDNSFANTIPEDSSKLSAIDDLLNMGDEKIGQAEDSPLYAQIDVPTFEDESSEIPKQLTQNHRAKEEDDTLFRMLAVKLGIDIDLMSRSEREKLVTVVGDLLMTIIEQLLETSKVVSDVSDNMGRSSHSTTNSATYNIVKQAKTPYDVIAALQTGSHSLVYEIKEIFREIDRHIVAHYTANRDMAGKDKDRFSPKKLYRLFEDEGLLEKSFINKKALAWEAYCDKFKYLDDPEGEKIEFENIKKMYLKSLESLNLGYRRYNK